MRADLFLAKAGYAKSREAARKSIDAGLVKINGKPVLKPAQDVDLSVIPTVTITPVCSFVGRGGIKLDFALRTFGVNPEGLVCADIGASTGGFTDCLLRGGAEYVYAIDSGHGQLDEHLAKDKRVANIEGCNARYIDSRLFFGPLDLIVMDVSFISQTLILPALSPVLNPGGKLISLVKPQFEAGRDAVGKGGIVKKADDRYQSVLKVKAAAEAAGLYMKALIPSPVTGGDGNHEYLALFTKEECIFAVDRKMFG